MADAFVSTEKRAALDLRMVQLGVREAELIEKFILGSGSGGQKINKTSSCVYLKHLPTGIEVKCQQSRSRDLNRFLARRELCERITERIEGARSKRQQEHEKIRRQKRRRSRRQKERMLEDKKHQSSKKQMRGKAGFLALMLAVGMAGGVHAESIPTRAPDTGAPTSAMSIGQAVVLGVVEGVTEYLPVSSTGHLLLAQRLMGVPSTSSGQAPSAGSGQGGEEAKEAADAYAICIQAGAILAVLGLYWRRIWGMVMGVLEGIGRAARRPPLPGAGGTIENDEGLKLAINLIVAFIPAAVVGVLLEGLIKRWLFGDGAWGLWPMAGAWFVGGVVILGVEWKRKLSTSNFQLSTFNGEGEQSTRRSRAATSSLEALTWRMAGVIGVVQCLAMWPGVSRSLATILGGLAVGLSMGAAVEFSFLLGLLTLSASTVLDGIQHGGAILEHYGVGRPLLGLLVAMVSAAIAVKWMVGYLQRHGLAIFGWYRIGLGIVVAVWMIVD